MAGDLEFIETTVTQIRDLYECREGQEETRGYLGGSAIGRECERELFYGFRWAWPVEFGGRMLRLFQRGHKEEAWLVQDLKDCGLKVWDLNPEGNQWKVQWFNGMLSGHTDGVILGLTEAPETPHLFECKTSNDKGFKLIVKQGVKEAKPVHFAQMQLYMLGMDLKRAAYFVVNKDNDEIHFERIEFDAKFAEQLLKKAKRVIFRDEVPERISEDASFYKCRFCDFGGQCHGTEKIAPTKSCRTCAHVSVTEEGFQCRLAEGITGDPSDGVLSKAEQFAACEHYTCHPTFMVPMFGEAVPVFTEGDLTSLRFTYNDKPKTENWLG